VTRPNDAINEFKLLIVIQLLRRSERVVGRTDPLRGFVEFDEDALPSKRIANISNPPVAVAPLVAPVP